MYPSNIWCKLTCIKDNQTCIFENSCGYRKTFLRAFRRKQSTSMRRHGKWNGNEKEESYIPYHELITLAKKYLTDGFCCHYCGKPMGFGIPNSMDTCTIDHIKSIVRGGSNAIDNIVLCCEWCNIQKGGNDFYWKQGMMQPKEDDCYG